jgi:hypothetical protein
MSGRLYIRYIEGDRETEISRPVGDNYGSFAKPGPDRADLAKALASATVELLDAAHPTTKENN